MITKLIEDSIKKYSELFGIPIPLVKAIIKKESSFNPYAIRVEKGFWKRYFEGIKKKVLQTKNKKDDFWLQYPDFMSASYGLMQLMLPVAIELGFVFDYPTELLDIDENIGLGCRKLFILYKKYKQWNDVISAFNQGNNRKGNNSKYINQKYVDDVLQFMKEFSEVGE